jgi:hypothetical protein
VIFEAASWPSKGLELANTELVTAIFVVTAGTASAAILESRVGDAKDEKLAAVVELKAVTVGREPLKEGVLLAILPSGNAAKELARGMTASTFISTIDSNLTVLLPVKPKSPN